MVDDRLFPESCNEKSDDTPSKNVDDEKESHTVEDTDNATTSPTESHRECKAWFGARGYTTLLSRELNYYIHLMNTSL